MILPMVVGCAVHLNNRLYLVNTNSDRAQFLDVAKCPVNYQSRSRLKTLPNITTTTRTAKLFCVLMFFKRQLMVSNVFNQMMIYDK